MNASGFESKAKGMKAATVLFAALCVVGVALLASAPTRANDVPTRFVSPDGNNDGLCRQQDPCRDIVTAVNISKIYDGSRSNAEIWIAAGEYNAGFGMNSNVQLRGEGADQVKINVDSGSTGISLYSQEDAGTTHVTMSGLTIQAKPRPAGYTGVWSSRGIEIQPHGGGAGHHLTLENVAVKDFDWFESGAGISNRGGHLTLKENTVIENNRSTGQGGGVYALGGSVNVQDSVIKNNRAGSYGGGVSADQASLNVGGSKVGNNTGVGLGGGINANVVTMNNSAVGGNTLQNGNGGGVFAATSLTASNSSFVGNQATGGGGSGTGGGFLTSNATLTNVTVGGNSAASNGGGVWANGTTSVTNTLIAGNIAPSGPDCQATLSTTNGHNMIGNNSGCGGLTNNQNGNRVGTAQNPINARLYELEIDEMPAAMELLSGSPANSAGHAATCLAAPIDDKSQFGGSRNTAARGDKCDIGAYDYGEQIPAGTPDAPTNVTGSAGNGTVALNWTPGYDGGSGTNGYTVTCSPACPEGATGLSLSTGQPGTTIRGLANGTSYTFRVASKNLIGTGPASAPSSEIKAVATPGAPTNVQAAAGNGSAALTWDAPPNNGAEISSYRITCAPACDGSGGSPVTGNPAPTSATLTGLANGTSYTFQVRATNSVGEGAASSPSNAVVTNAPPVAQNQSPTMDEDGTKLITLAANDSDDDAMIYRITALTQSGSLYRGDSTASADRISSAGTNLISNRVTYKPNADYHGTDSFKFTANDGKTNGNEATVSMAVNPVNDAPVLDLNGGAGGTGFSATFTEGEGPEQITDSGKLTLADMDDENMASATIRITNMKDGASERLSASNHPDITQEYDEATGALTLIGPASKAALQQILRTVAYENTSQNPDTADRIVTFVANDGEADSSNENSTVSVVSVNDAPTVELEGDDTADEGDVKTYTYTVADPDGPAPEISESCGENGVKTDTPEPDSFECAFPDGPSNSIVSVGADDGGESSGEDSIEVRVSNVAPSISLAGPDAADEGDTKTYTYTVADPGENDAHTMDTDCGSNGVEVEDSGAYDPETKEGSFECRFPNGPATTEVVAKVADSDGDSGSDDQKVAVAVANVAPAVELSGASQAKEGGVKTYTYTVGDPGDPELSITEDCGSNGVYINTGNPDSFKCRFPDGPATSTVGVRAEDDAATGSDSIEVRVSNVAPRVALRGPANAKGGQTKVYKFSVRDPGEDRASFAAGFPKCGDGARLAGKNIGANGGGFRCKFAAGPSKRMVSLKVEDSDGAASKPAGKKVSVRDPPEKRNPPPARPPWLP